MCDGNLEALNKYEGRCEQEEKDYNEMLEELYTAEPEDYPDIMEEYGFGELDMIDIMKDLVC